MRRAARPAGEHGFTLLETLVALAVLGAVLSTAFAVIGGGLRAAHRDEERMLVALMAQNLLARTRLDLVPDDGVLTGTVEGGLRWRIESEPYRLPPPAVPKNAATADADRPTREEKARALSERLDDGLDARDGARRGSGFERDDPPFGGEEDDAADGSRRLGEPEAKDRDAQGRFGARRSERQERREVRLRRVRVTVEKGQESFVLTGLAMEPPRERRPLR